MALSNSEIDQLGDRLRNHCLEDGDLEKLDEFRQTYSDIDAQAYSLIQDALQECTDKLVITKIKRKTRQSIVDKLCRQKNYARARCRIFLVVVLLSGQALKRSVK